LRILLNINTIDSSKARRNVKYAKQPNSDFDPLSVKDGLDAIDLEIADIDQYMPSIEYDQDDYETEELMKANKILRLKVGQITDLVVQAIKKASNIKKQINTHRKKPNDPELNKKLAIIAKYQKNIQQMKKKIVGLKVRYNSISYKDRVVKIQNEIKTEEEELVKIEEQNAILERRIAESTFYNLTF
jgi:hypothetical protein